MAAGATSSLLRRIPPPSPTPASPSTAPAVPAVSAWGYAGNIVRQVDTPKVAGAVVWGAGAPGQTPGGGGTMLLRDS